MDCCTRKKSNLDGKVKRFKWKHAGHQAVRFPVRNITFILHPFGMLPVKAHKS